MSRDLIKHSEFAPLDLLAESGFGGVRTRLGSPGERVRDLVARLDHAEEHARCRVDEAVAGARVDARNELAREFGVALKALRAAAQALEDAREREKDVAVDEIVKLATAIAAKVVRREVAGDDEYVVRLVRRCLRRIPFPAPVRVRLHPDDLARVSDAREALAPDATALQATLEADRRVERGGCIVETPDFVVDGRAETQLAAARAAMVVQS